MASVGSGKEAVDTRLLLLFLNVVNKFLAKNSWLTHRYSINRCPLRRILGIAA